MKNIFTLLFIAFFSFLITQDLLAQTTDHSFQQKRQNVDQSYSYKSTAKIDSLLKRLMASNDKIKIKNIQDKLIKATSNIKCEDSQVAPFLVQLSNNTPNRDRILEILPYIGGKQALKAVTSYISSNNKDERDAAFNALINWKDCSASASLYEVCKASDGEKRSEALKGFIREISNSNLPGEQKLLQYRKIIPLATNNDKRLIITSMGKVKTFLSLMTVASFLDDHDLESQAIKAVMEVALPSNSEKGLSGIVVRNVLSKALANLKGKDKDFDRTRIRKYLTQMSYRHDGFVPMFNGKNLSGWQGLVGNPVTRAKMDPKELALKQTESNLKLVENWSVKNDCIVFNGAGYFNLCSVKQYGDFEMVVDWKITKNGDSGIYLRGSPQVQIWDTANVSDGAQVGSGGLYNNKINISKPLKVADNPVGEWNTFWIKMVGDRVTVILNGELVVDNVQMENYWDRTIPIFSKGPIELQAHGSDLAFRDIYVQELN